MDQLNTPDNDGLFPTSASFFIFWSYISLFVSQGLLVTAVQRSQIVGFNAVVVVLLVEVTKLLICIIIYLLRSPYDGGITGALGDLSHDIRMNKRLLLLYLVPASLYCLYNNLTFINLSLFDVATYYCLMQFRIVLTALIYQVLFKRKLTHAQWGSLLLLTLGCLAKQYGLYDAPPVPAASAATSNNSTITTTTPTIMGNLSAEAQSDYQRDDMSRSAGLVAFLWSTSLLLIQMFCSCFAGVYNEYLLKESSLAKGADVILQNIFMYLDSIICNLVALKLSSAYFGTSSLLFSDMSLASMLYSSLTSPLILLLILNNAASGLVASFFLKSLNSILKTFASALELFAVTFLAWLLFGNKVDLYTIMALVLVSLATMMYSRNPVSVAPPAKLAKVDNMDGFVMLPMSERH